MKNLLLLTMLLAIPFSGISQRNFSERIDALKLGDINGAFRTQLVDAVLSAECCFYDKCKCDDLKDPWEDDKISTMSQQLSMVLKDKSSAKVQRDMANLERTIIRGNGGKVISKKFLMSIFKKNQGYSLNAISKRLEDIIQKMESVDDDE